MFGLEGKLHRGIEVEAKAAIRHMIFLKEEKKIFRMILMTSIKVTQAIENNYNHNHNPITLNLPRLIDSMICTKGLCNLNKNKKIEGNNRMNNVLFSLLFLPKRENQFPN